MSIAQRPQPYRDEAAADAAAVVFIVEAPVFDCCGRATHGGGSLLIKLELKLVEKCSSQNKMSFESHLLFRPFF